MWINFTDAPTPQQFSYSSRLSSYRSGGTRPGGFSVMNFRHIFLLSSMTPIVSWWVHLALSLVRIFLGYTSSFFSSSILLASCTPARFLSSFRTVLLQLISSPQNFFLLISLGSPSLIEFFRFLWFHPHQDGWTSCWWDTRGSRNSWNWIIWFFQRPRKN